MRKKILLLPLDERPCNFKFPLLMPSADIRIIRPPRELLGNKKLPADCKEIARWVIENVRDVYAVVLSMDMLIRRTCPFKASFRRCSYAGRTRGDSQGNQKNKSGRKTLRISDDYAVSVLFFEQ